MSDGKLHPTARKLVDTVSVLLETQQPHDIGIEQVLRESGVSSGSLYHHFKDFSDLMDHALVEQYAQLARVQTAALAQVLDASASVDDLERNLHELIRQTHAKGMAPARAVRANIVSQAAVRPGLRELLAVEQDNLTGGIADVITQGQAKGWLWPDLDPRVLATFIQAYSLGRIVDDIADPGVDNDAWVGLIQRVVSSWLVR